MFDGSGENWEQNTVFRALSGIKFTQDTQYSARMFLFRKNTTFKM